MVLGVLAMLTVAVALVGDWQWQALRAAHAGRALAFRLAAGELPFGSTATRAGGVATRARRLSVLAAHGQLGPVLDRLRREWAGPRDGLWQADAGARVFPGGRAWTAGQRLGVATRPLNRQTTILVGAGHASGDAHTQRRIASAPTAWRSAAQSSLQAGRAVAARLRGVDRGWRRPPPRFDWLQPWHDLVPANRLRGAGAQRPARAAAARSKDLTASGAPAFGRVRAVPGGAP